MNHVRSLLPNFCTWQAAAEFIVAIELLSILIVVITESEWRMGFIRLFWASLHLQTIALISLGFLCSLRGMPPQKYARTILFLCFSFIVLISMMVGEIAWQIAGLCPIVPPIPFTHTVFLVHCFLVTVIVSALFLRYFLLYADHQAHAHADAQTQYLALQARIRPHFLFNSLNSISALILSNPPLAEEMVMDLSDLFRVSLQKNNRLVSLSEEVEFVKTYVRIEQIRLGDKLSLNWQISPEAEAAKVPLLILQPLVENAVYHGISRLTHRGEIVISAQKINKILIVEVTNPVPPQGQPAARKGAGIATENIAQRLALIYGPEASLEKNLVIQENGDEVFLARIRAPFIDKDE